MVWGQESESTRIYKVNGGKVQEMAGGRTTDAGHIWFVWDGDKNIPDGRQHNLSPAPKEVDLHPDGTGRMVLYPFFKEREKGPDLYTSDYGQHWSMRQY